MHLQNTAKLIISLKHQVFYIVIADIDGLFDTEANNPALVTVKLLKSMDLPSKDDVAKVKQWLNNGAMTLLWHLHGQEAFV